MWENVIILQANSIHFVNLLRPFSFPLKKFIHIIYHSNEMLSKREPFTKTILKIDIVCKESFSTIGDFFTIII